MKRPWYAVAIAAGFGAVLGTVYALAPKAEHSVLPTAIAAPVAMPDDTQRWRERMEAKLDALTEKVARIEGELKGRSEH